MIGIPLSNPFSLIVLNFIIVFPPKIKVLLVPLYSGNLSYYFFSTSMNKSFLRHGTAK